jgi:PE family
MSFVIAAPEAVTAAAGNLAGIGSTLGEATAAAAAPTTGVAAAAADEVSIALSEIFGTYGQQFQALSAQASAFHNEFVSLLNGGAAAYLSAEAANAGQTLANATSTPAAGATSAAGLLGGLLGGGGTPSTGLLGGLLGGGGTSSTGLLGGLLGGGLPNLTTLLSPPNLGGLTTGLNTVLGGLTSGFSSLSGGFSSLSGGFSSLFSGFNPSSLATLLSGGSFNANPFITALTNLTGPINFGNLGPGLNLTSGPLGPTFGGIGLDLSNFLSNELANGITLSNLESLTTGLFQDVPALQGLLPLLQDLLPGLFPTSSTVVGAYPNPYQVLGETTVINLNLIGSQFMNHPFPILNQIASNQSHYFQEFSNGVAIDLANFPANVPANFQLAIQGASTFNPAAMGQTFVNGTSGFYGTVGTSLQNFGSAIQGTLPTFENDMGLVGTAIAMGDYSGAVEHGGRGALDLFIAGFDTSQLGIGGTLSPIALTISGPVGLLGPAGALLPILTAMGQQVQGLASLMPAGSIPAQMVGHFANGLAMVLDGGISADFDVNASVLPVGATLAGDAIFGFPLQLGFAVLGFPFTTLNGFATGATAFSTALQTGNALGALNAIADTPAYALNGMLNGSILVDLPLPVSTDGVTLPSTAHLPFQGLLTPPQQLTVTMPLSVLGIPVPINATLGGTEFAGLFPFLVNTLPDQFALAISPGASTTA